LWDKIPCREPERFGLDSRYASTEVVLRESSEFAQAHLAQGLPPDHAVLDAVRLRPPDVVQESAHAHQVQVYRVVVCFNFPGDFQSLTLDR